ncbi:hypothetical protein PVK06_048398 [Gossypium arboreum]|uniref:Retrovirus-related Pol polyprotein from transposon TNT 1-94 n=1 Tax=Gossypium arboreum TaxID=29729 RepID=A0ABR0MHV2_GOSAR|nr:hypothetical protein PVK06_048398 [Gossypium arboreum]
MATDIISGNEDEHRQSFNTATHADGSSHDPGNASMRKIQQFPKHDTVKLGEHNFLLWKQQVLLILEGYGLLEFVLGTVSVPPQSVVDKDSNLVPNPEFLFHKQQDKLLASWLLTTIGDEILVHLTAARSSFDVWNTVVCRFASKSALTVSTLRHSLYSLKKGQLTVKEYLAKIKGLCDNLTTAGNTVSEQEQISVILAGLPMEFESIRSGFCKRVPLDLLIEMLADCEARQQELVSNVTFQANFVQQRGSTDDTISKSDRGSRPPYRGNGRFSRGRGRGRKFSNTKPQCQLCGRVGHTVQKCYYRFDENFEGVSDQPLQAHCHQFQGTSTSCAGHHCCSHRTALTDFAANSNHLKDGKIILLVFFLKCVSHYGIRAIIFFFLMATDAISGNEDEHRQSFNTAAHADGFSHDLGNASMRKIQQFPKHDTVKLGEHNFLLWKQQVLLILEGYGLHEFILGTVSVPPQSVVDKDSNLVPNPEFLFHKQQDKLLASWLLTTIGDEILVHLTAARSSFDVWNTVVRRFASKSALTISVILAGLPVEFESIRIVASAMRVPLDLLTEMLADCEARQ